MNKKSSNDSSVPEASMQNLGELYLNGRYEEAEVLALSLELAAKLAELMPLSEIEMKAVMASRRASIDDGDINAVIELVRQHVGIE